MAATTGVPVWSVLKPFGWVTGHSSNIYKSSQSWKFVWAWSQGHGRFFHMVTAFFHRSQIVTPVAAAATASMVVTTPVQTDSKSADMYTTTPVCVSTYLASYQIFGGASAHEHDPVITLTCA